MIRTLRLRLAELRAQESGPFEAREHGSFRVALVYPNTYEVGMSNLGLQVNHWLLNRIEGVTCERAFLPAREDDALFSDGRAPVLTIESGRPLIDQHVVAFSITHELDYVNVARILRRADIDPLKGRRRPTDPLVIAGGPAITANPAPLDEIVDLFWIGESEDSVGTVFDALAQRFGQARLLEDLAGLPHVHVPGVTRHADVYVRAPRVDIDLHPAFSRILTPRTVFAATGLVELARGCARACRFCLARAIYHPLRVLSPRTVQDVASTLEPHTKRLGLFGPGLSDYPDLTGLVDSLSGRGFTVSVSSLRLATLTAGVLRSLVHAGQRTVTVAPESFSERILRFLGKGASLDHAGRGLAEIAASGVTTAKVYLMVGVPGETDDDVLAAVKALSPHVGRGATRWHLSLSILLPRPHTPLEGLPLAPKKELEARLKALRKAVGRLGIQLALPSVRDAWTADLLCRGDSRVGLEIVRQLEASPDESFSITHARYLELMAGTLGAGRFPWSNPDLHDTSIPRSSNSRPDDGH